MTPTDATAGASGAIFGVLGALLVLERRGTINSGGQILMLIVINLVITFAIPGISIGGHIGGLVAGIVVMLAYVRFRRSVPLSVAAGAGGGGRLARVRLRGDLRHAGRAHARGRGEAAPVSNGGRLLGGGLGGRRVRRRWRCAAGSCWRRRRARSSTEIAARAGLQSARRSASGGAGSRVAGWMGLHDEPRPGKPRSISDEDVERVIVKTLEEQPRDATHWSTRSMAAATGMSQTAVSRIWRAFGLKPHQTETFKLSPDPQFIDKVRDIVGLYLNPPEAAVVLCVDEKSQIQALDRISAGAAADAGRARSGRPTTTSATAPPTSTPPSMSPPGR